MKFLELPIGAQIQTFQTKILKINKEICSQMGYKDMRGLKNETEADQKGAANTIAR
ncbi:MAG: hypothetical protein IPO92_07270 [Saprospiraceae bacterium]|nr:hypothetical protein [Saprospiraceae bacterium]